VTAPVPRIFFCDLDGTLLDDDGSLHPDSVQAFKELAARGTRIVLASGRIPLNMVEVCEALELKGPQITMNGALLCSPLTWEILHAHALDERAVREHLRFARERDVRAVLAYPDHYKTENVDPLLRRDFDAQLPEEAPDVDELARSRPYKTYLMTGAVRFREILDEATELFSGRYHVTSGDDVSVELLHPRANKGDAAEALAAHLGVPMSEVAAAGDGLNDVELLRAAGVSIAMHEAPSSVHEAADLIAPPRSQGGLVRAVEQLFAV
jgi:Cof subfamily protein (haloacid dehalogenase superfamily)